MRVSRLLCLALVAAVAIAVPGARARAVQQLEPADTVLAFYGLLREQRYLEGFSYSVYRDAVDGLSEADLVELTPDFQRTFAAIPPKIEVKGTQVSGDTATVFIGFDGERVDEVSLVRVGGQWLVGDAEAHEQVQRDRSAFFFNARIHVNHGEVYRILKQMIGAQEQRAQAKQPLGTLADLVAQEGLKEDFAGDDASGYRFIVNLTPDRDAYTIVAIPQRYGRTGRLSFFSAGRSVHAADAEGMPVNEQAPVMAEQEIGAPIQ